MTTKTTQHVAIIGLGIMGKAMTKHFSEQGFHVECWNRGQTRRQAVQDMSLPRVTVHESLEDAVRPVQHVILIIVGDADLCSVRRDIVESLPAEAWKGKTVINFCSHEPFAARLMEESLAAVEAHHVAGAMIAVPENLGSQGAVILVSPSARSLDVYEDAEPVLRLLGRLERFDGDIGYAALVDIGIIWGCFLGINGYELAVKAFEKYQASDETHDRLLSLCKELLPLYIDPFFSVTSATIRNKTWNEGGISTTAVANKLYAMHQTFLDKVGIVDDTIVGSMAKYCKKAYEANPDAVDSYKVTQYDKE